MHLSIFPYTNNYLNMILPITNYRPKWDLTTIQPWFSSIHNINTILTTLISQQCAHFENGDDSLKRLTLNLLENNDSSHSLFMTMWMRIGASAGTWRNCQSGIVGELDWYYRQDRNSARMAAVPSNATIPCSLCVFAPSSVCLSLMYRVWRYYAYVRVTYTGQATAVRRDKH